MPYYDKPQVFAKADVEDVDKFNRLPFYLVKNEVKLFPRWNIWDGLFGTIPWQPNFGDTMKGVRPEYSPIGRTLFYPNRINTDPLKDIIEHNETTEEAQLRWHDYHSKLISFLPSWEAFRTTQLDFSHEDMVHQIQWANNLFVRTTIFDASRHYLCAGTDSLQTGAPTGMGNTTQDAVGSKTAAWIVANVIPNIQKNLSLKVVKLATQIASEDIGIPFFEGAANQPSINEALKGRYCLIGSNEAWLQFDDDPDWLQKKNNNQDTVLDFTFTGSLYNRIIYKCDRYPLRFGDDGKFIPPEVTHAETGETWINPNYSNPSVAKYEVAFLVGQGLCRTIKVGPPPRDFSTVTKDKFFKMRWNGEIRLTDQVVIRRGSIAGSDLDFDFNEDGRFLRFKATTIHGLLMGQRRNVIPIFFQRRRISTT